LTVVVMRSRIKYARLTNRGYGYDRDDY